MTTKVLALTDSLGNLVRFVLLPGQRYDTVGVAPLITDIEFGGLIADTWGLIYLMALFAGALVYALWPRNRKKFDDAARIPLEED